MIGVRLNTFNDNCGEPEQDANSALTELDKGLRSNKVGEQCEAIVRFPRLFEKYPFPILINSSFLKLADVFRVGNNFLRLWVLRVCQQSEKHLDKILNVDEFLRRIFSVLHSNDPVARALALRTLGAVAGIIPERQNVHHAIRRGLDSHDNVEVDAAIYATTRFAAHSNSFAVAMCNKISDMVESESTGANRRAKLVRALRTVHGGAIRAQGVLRLLRSLLERFPSSSAVRAAITALTAIAADTVVHVPDQVELLLNIAMKDARAVVRRSALVGLQKLAEHAALWPEDCVKNLVACAQSQPMHTMLCLQVMQVVVTRGPAAASAPLLSYCRAAALGPSLPRAATAAQLLTTLTLHCYEENLPVDSSDLMLTLESLVIATGVPDQHSNKKPLRIALKCMVQLSNAEPLVYAARTAEVVGKQLEACSWREGGVRVTSLLEALAALSGPQRAGGPLGGGPQRAGGPLGGAQHAGGPLGGGPQRAGGPLGGAMPAVRACLDAVERGETSESNDGLALVLLCTVIMQERASAALSHRIDNTWQDRLLAAARHSDPWTRYRLARAATRYGHHRLAATILNRLSEEAPSESAQRWLTTLYKAALADSILAEEGISSAGRVYELWSWGWGAGGGSAGGAGRGAARGGALLALARAAGAARALCSQPPPAVQHVQSMRDPAAKCGACAVSIRRAAKALSAAARKFADLASTAFHADDNTLRHLHISQYNYSQLAQFLDRIASNQPERDMTNVEMKATTLEESIALLPSVKLAKISSILFDNPTTQPGITHRHCEAILAAVNAYCHGGVWSRGAWGGPGGAGGAGAACRLSLTPAAPEPAPLPPAHRLALTMEGVILQPEDRRKRQKKRKVKSVQITVTATPHPKTNEKTVELTNIPPVLTAVQTVTPVRDFFSAQQLVSVNNPGLYTVAVEAAFIDEKGQLWNTGPKNSIVIKAHEDPNSKGNVPTTRGRF